MNSAETKILIALLAALSLGVPGVRAGEDEKFRQMDADGDARITRAEHAAAAQILFRQLDADSDEILAAAELEKPESRTGVWDRDEPKSADEKVAEMDSNLDGRISRGEHEAGTALIFGRMDTDNDGYLSRDECLVGHKALKKAL